MLSKYFKNQKDQTDFFIAIVVIALAGLAIGYYSLSTNQPFIAKVSDSLISNPHIESLEVEGKTFVALETKNVLAKKKRHLSKDNYENDLPMVNDTIRHVEATNISELEVETEEILEDELDDIVDNDDEEELDADFSEEEEVVIPEISDDSETDQDVVADVEDIEEDIVEESSDVIPAITNKAESKVNQRGECIIVIGAFGNERNIKKLIGKLDFKGYPIFKVPFNGLTRVGVYEDCSTVDETLIMIQNKYSPDAFIMKAR